MSNISDIFGKIRYTSVATASLVGQPWNAPVFYIYDSKYNIYWFSDVEAVHSQDIHKTGHAFLTIFDSTAPEGEGKGLQIEARAMRIEDATEISEVVSIYNSFTNVFKVVAENMSGDSPTRFYKAVPQRIWTNIEGEKNGNYVDMREELEQAA